MTLTAQQPKGRCASGLGPRSRSLGTCFADNWSADLFRRFVGTSSPILGRGVAHAPVHTLNVMLRCVCGRWPYPQRTAASCVSGSQQECPGQCGSAWGALLLHEWRHAWRHTYPVACRAVHTHIRHCSDVRRGSTTSVASSTIMMTKVNQMQDALDVEDMDFTRRAPPAGPICLQLRTRASACCAARVLTGFVWSFFGDDFHDSTT